MITQIPPSQLGGLVAIVLLAGGAGAQTDSLLITEVVDGTLTGGRPKWVELTNTGNASLDLTQFSFGYLPGGSTTLGGGAASVLTGILGGGQSYVLCYDIDPGPGAGVFHDVYGTDPDFYTGLASINGDDVLALYLGAATGDGSNGELIDVYGVIGTDGTGESWEYRDSFSIRCGDLANGGVFDESDWHFEGPGGLEVGCGGDDACETANLQNWTTPWIHTGCSGPGVSYCPGDGIAPHTPCPCGNNNGGSPGGCDWANPAFPGGGQLEALGSNSLGAGDTVLVATAIENSFGIFFGANNAVNGGNGNPLNDGLRCAGGGLVRLTPPTMASGNAATTPLPIQTLDLGASPGAARRYQYWFRTPTGPCGQTANLTNGYEIVWSS